MSFNRHAYSPLFIAALLALPVLAHAQSTTQPAPATPEHVFTGNLSLNSDYRFRGISQTYKSPAVQGGFDYAHASGLYLGTWASNVSGNQYPGGSLEWDFYGGFKATHNDINLDAGLLYYAYPQARLPHGPSGHNGSEKFDNLEIYASASWQWLSAKYSYGLSDFFGVKNNTYGGVCNRDGVDCFAGYPGNSRGSGYLDVTATVPLADKLSMVAHVGHQTVTHYGRLSYTDWKLGLTYDLNGFQLGAAYIDTNANPAWYYVGGTKGIRQLGKNTIMLSVGKTF